MDPVSTAILMRAIDGLHQRYMFTAQNIANANSPDYQPVRVSFEDALRAAAPQGVNAVRNAPSRVFADETTEGGEMRLDLELAMASQTSGRYRALLDILSREMSLEHTIAVGGR